MVSRRWDGLAFGSFALALAATAAVYDRLPDPLPTHFDLHGTPNGWMPKAVGAWALPVIGIALWALVRFLPRILPRSDRSRLGNGMVPVVAAMTGAFVAAVHGVILYVAVVPGSSVLAPVYLLMGVLFVGLGLVIPRVRRNPIIGVRTPWTLTNDENWARTQRVGGYSMVLGGIAGALLGAFGGATGSVMAIACFLVAGFVPVVYSLVLARRRDEAS